jgi:hypothetical protein
VQYKLDSNKQIKNSGKGTHTFLTGLLKCRKCGYSVAVASSYNGKTYLACKGKYTVNACTGFTKTVQVAEVEKVATIKIKQKVEQMRQWTFQMEDGNSRKMINELKSKLVNIDEQIGNLIEGLANGNTVAKKYINAKLEALDAEKTNTENEMKKIMLEENRRMPIDSYLDKIDNWDELEFEDKKQVCKALMDRVLIFDDDIDIEWKF